MDARAIALFVESLHNDRPFDEFFKYAKLFDIPKDSWSLDGYIAAKLKAKELCESETAKRNAIVAFNH